MATLSSMPQHVPGIDLPLSYNDLALASVTASRLPRIHNGMHVPDTHLQQLVAIVASHNMVGKLALHLLHSHEPLDENKIKVQGKLKNAPGTSMRSISTESIDPKSLHGLAFKVRPMAGENNILDLIPYEFGEGQSPILGDKGAFGCIAELAAYISGNDLVDVFALQLVDRSALSACPTAEIEVEGYGTMTLPQSMYSVLKPVPVSWPSSSYDGISKLSSPPAGEHWNESTKPDGTKTHKVHVDNGEIELDILKRLSDQGVIIFTH